MKLSDRIRNFRYAVTHANELIAERNEFAEKAALLQKALAAEQAHSKEQQKETQETYQAILHQFLPKSLDFSQLFSMYRHARSLDPDSSIRIQERKKAYSRLGYICGYGKEYSSHIDCVAYNNALVRLGVLMNGRYINAPTDQMKEIIREHYKELPENMPVGKIEWLGLNGTPYGSTRYKDPAEFVDAIHQSADVGEPMAITVFKDPGTGKHMDTSWMLDVLNPTQNSLQMKDFDMQKELAEEAEQDLAPENTCEMEM